MKFTINTPLATLNQFSNSGLQSPTQPKFRRPLTASTEKTESMQNQCRTCQKKSTTSCCKSTHAFGLSAQILAGLAGLGSSSPLGPGPPGGVAAAMKPNLAKVLSQSHRKLKVVFWYKTKQIIDIVVKLLVCCANLPQGYGNGLAAPERAGGSQGIPRHSEAFRGAIQGSKDLGSRSNSDRQRQAKGLEDKTKTMGCWASRWAKSFEGPKPNSEAFRGTPPRRARDAPGGQIHPKSASESRKPQNCKISPDSLKNLTNLTKIPKTAADCFNCQI